MIYLHYVGLFDKTLQTQQWCKLCVSIWKMSERESWEIYDNFSSALFAIYASLFSLSDILFPDDFSLMFMNKCDWWAVFLSGSLHFVDKIDKRICMWANDKVNIQLKWQMLWVFKGKYLHHLFQNIIQNNKGRVNILLFFLICIS